MKSSANASQLLDLLNQALARELQVSVQYMLQHGVAAGRKLAQPAGQTTGKSFDFVASHSLYFLPGATLKKIAITEMRHAEAISERIVILGGEPVTSPGKIVLAKSAQAMIEDDLGQERGAIDLYGTIIEHAKADHDEITEKMFTRILKDEESHYKIFEELLE